MSSPSFGLVLLLVVLVVFVLGLRVFYAGWAQRADTVERARLGSGERVRRRVRGAVEQRIRRTEAGRRVENRLLGAGVDLGVVDFAGLLAAISLAAYVVTDRFTPGWFAGVTAVVAVRACFLWLDRKRAQRRDEFVAQLPDLARVLSNASSAGLSLRSALDMASAELAAPAATELALVTEELALGQSIDASLERLQDRMPSREVGVLVATLVIQQRAGGDLVRSLRDMADTLDSRKDLRREVRTIMAGAVFTSYIVAALGFGTLFLLNATSPGVIDDMFSSGPGRFALFAAAGLYALGFVLIRRTTRIDT